MTKARILIVGFDPYALQGGDAEEIERGLTLGFERVRKAGYAVEQVLVPLSEAAADLISNAVRGGDWDVVVIGGGIRKPEPLLSFFEAVVNIVHADAPGAKIAFNGDGGSSLEAIERVLTDVSS
jgi:hypothetical protein